MLIATRAFMGIGGALIMPATLSLLTNVFRDPKERARAIAIWAGFSGVGVAHRPADRRLPARALLVALGLLGERPDRDRRPRRRPLLRARRRRTRARRGSTSSAPCSPSSASSPWCGRSSRRPGKGWTSTPSSPRLRRRRVLPARRSWPGSCAPTTRCSTCASSRTRGSPPPTSAITLTFFAMFGSMFLITPVAAVRAWASRRSRPGVRMAPYALAMMIVAPLSARFVERFGTKARGRHRPRPRGRSACSSLSFITVTTSYPSLLARMFVMAVGMGLTMAPATESVMGSLPRAKAGVGSAVNDTTRQVGGALGVAVIGSLVSSVYATQLAKGLAASACRRPRSTRPAKVSAWPWRSASRSVGRAGQPDRPRGLHQLRRRPLGRAARRRRRRPGGRRHRGARLPPGPGHGARRRSTPKLLGTARPRGRRALSGLEGLEGLELEPS